MKTVSVVVPCYNVGEYQRDCLDSVMAQIPSALEIICVDDHSSDETLAILDDYEKKWPGRITVIRHLTNRGAPSSRNDGMRVARGDYIQFLDADDVLLPGKFMHQLQLVEGEEQPMLVAASFTRKRVNGTSIEHQIAQVQPLQALINSGLGITSANLWPRKALLGIGGWDEKLGSSQEYNLMFRLIKCGVGVAFDTESKTIIRERVSGSITHKDPPGNCRRFIDLRVQILRYGRETSAGKAIEKAALQVIFEWIHFLYRYDSEAAKALYAEHIRGQYRPRYSKLLNWKFMVLYRLLGFETAEKIRVRLFSRSA